MRKDVLEKIEVGLHVTSGMECTCDKEVGWVCETCSLIMALEGAKSLLTQRAADGAYACPECGQFEEFVVCWKCGSTKTPHR